MSNRFLIRYTIFALLFLITGAVVFYHSLPDIKYPVPSVDKTLWQVPDLNSMPSGAEGALIRYGKDLIINTAHYLGPRGSVAKMSNGMNCQNCHLQAGTRLNGNCFALVANTYPKFKLRSGREESIEFRVNDCMERSLNGKKLDSSSRETFRATHAAIVAVIIF